jgi:PAS domain S-box-containing protein
MQIIGNEKILDDTSLLVSETDAKGKIIYANDLFLELAEYSLEEMVGKPHNIIRHPDMPKIAFKELWETIQKGEVWQGFVKNNTKSGKFYWVYATVFPFGKNHYLSVRKMATRDEIAHHEKLYQEMKKEEK